MEKVNIQQHSARMRRLMTILWTICATLVVLERFSAATIDVIRSGYAAEAWRVLAAQAVATVPEALFLLGLWWVRDALAAFARGELFSISLTKMLDRVGVVLACGAMLRILIVPGASRFLGVNAGYWIAFDTAALVLGAIGLALKAIAGVLSHASTVQSELDEIF